MCLLSQSKEEVMRYPDLYCFPRSGLKGLGDEPNREVFDAQKKAPVRVSRHRGFVRDEHDRFMPMWFNGINMPVNVKD